MESTLDKGLSIPDKKRNEPAELKPNQNIFDGEPFHNLLQLAAKSTGLDDESLRWILGAVNRGTLSGTENESPAQINYVARAIIRTLRSRRYDKVRPSEQLLAAAKEPPLMRRLVRGFYTGLKPFPRWHEYLSNLGLGQSGNYALNGEVLRPNENEGMNLKTPNYFKWKKDRDNMAKKYKDAEAAAVATAAIPQIGSINGYYAETDVISGKPRANSHDVLRAAEIGKPR